MTPEFAPDTNPAQWSQDAVSLAGLPSSCAQPTLLFYIHSACAHHIGQICQSTPADRSDAAILAFFEPYYSRLPNYDSSDPDCQAVAVLATNWVSDEFAGYGSYSNFQVGLQEADRDLAVMQEGMPERGVWFAGEHTAPFIATGTVTGAYWSGESVADRIAKSYDLLHKDKSSDI
jgi:hypothetical protein